MCSLLKPEIRLRTDHESERKKKTVEANKIKHVQCNLWKTSSKKPRSQISLQSHLIQMRISQFKIEFHFIHYLPFFLFSRSSSSVTETHTGWRKRNSCLMCELWRRMKATSNHDVIPINNKSAPKCC